MPVKVRCPTCQKVLNAPDKARGKSLKCPSCEGRIRVPGGTSSSSGPARKPAPAGKKRRRRPAGDDDFLGGVDLNRLEDRSADVCPKCGATVYESDELCSACGIDLETGKVRAKRRGPDPSLYYGEAWSNSWAFLMANKKLAFFTGAVWTLFVLLYIGGVVGIQACHRWEMGRVVADHKEEQDRQRKLKPEAGQERDELLDLTPAQVTAQAALRPPVVVLSFLTVLMAMGAPGWYWNVSAKVIEQTMRKKKLLEMKKVQFDFFETIIIGFKAYFWPYVLLLPVLFLLSFAIVPMLIASALALGQFGPFVVTLVSLGVYLTPIFAFPVAQVHMTMPYTYPAFLPWEMLKTFFRNIGPALYWLMMLILVTLPIMATVGILWYYFADDILVGITEAVRHSANWLLSLAGEKRSEESVGFLQWLFDTFCWALAALIVVAPFTMTFAPIGIFMMRANGLLGYYNRRTMDLVTRTKPDVPCGFWVRYLAALIDGLLMLIAMVLLNIAFDLATAGLNMIGYDFTLKARVYAFLGIFVFMPAYYYAKSEAGIFQGTLGKRSLGIKVTALDGKPLTMQQALGRYFGKFISTIILGGGFIMAGLTEQKQALHDTMAKALVVWEGSDDRS